MATPSQRMLDATPAARRDPPARSRRRTVVSVLFLIGCVALIPQIIYLAGALPQYFTATHWRLVWVGLDCMEATVFLLTGWLLFRGSRLVAVTAAMATALLWLDAWFDVLTSKGDELWIAAMLAIFVEVPLGAFCLFVAVREARRGDWMAREDETPVSDSPSTGAESPGAGAESPPPAIAQIGDGRAIVQDQRPASGNGQVPVADARGVLEEGLAHAVDGGVGPPSVGIGSASSEPAEPGGPGQTHQALQ